MKLRIRAERSIPRLEMTGLETELMAHEIGRIGVAPAARESSQQEKRMSTTLEGSVDFLDMRRLALELGTPGDHDISYKFTLPTSVSQTLDWAKLLAMVHQGEL